MPFTLSHAAAAWPLRRTRLVLSALVCGTFTPDFEYFLRANRGAHFGHSTAGILLFSLPLGLVCFCLYHGLLKQPATLLLPAGLRARAGCWLRPLPRLDLAYAGLVALSVLTGVLTHVGWDSFTHGTGWVCKHWALLRLQLRLGPGGTAPVYKLLQHLGTVAGALVLALWIAAWYRATPAGLRPQRTGAAVWTARIALPVLIFVGAYLRAQAEVRFVLVEPVVERWLEHFAVAGMALTCYGLLAWALVAKIFLRRQLRSLAEDGPAAE
jgi:hypothetical protein